MLCYRLQCCGAHTKTKYWLIDFFFPNECQLHSFSNVFILQNRKIISNIIFLNSYTDGTLDKVHAESFMMYFSFFFSCISVLKRNSKVTGYIVSYFADLHPSAAVKAAFINLKLIKAKKKKTFLFLLRSMILLLPLTLMREAESILKEKHKSGQAHLANMSVVLFTLVLLWRKTCDSDQAISSYTVRPTSLADKI